MEVVVVSWFCVGDLIPNLVPSLGTVEVVVQGAMMVGSRNGFCGGNGGTKESLFEEVVEEWLLELNKQVVVVDMEVAGSVPALVYEERW